MKRANWQPILTGLIRADHRVDAIKLWAEVTGLPLRLARADIDAICARQKPLPKGNEYRSLRLTPDLTNGLNGLRYYEARLQSAQAGRRAYDFDTASQLTATHRRILNLLEFGPYRVEVISLAGVTHTVEISNRRGPFPNGKLRRGNSVYKAAVELVRNALAVEIGNPKPYEGKGEHNAVPVGGHTLHHTSLTIGRR